MPISTSCPQCLKKFKVADHLAGKKVNCPACKVVVPIPTAVSIPDDLQLDLPSTAQAAPVEDDLALSAPGGAPEPQKDLVRCPTCGKDVEAGSILCVSCGYNFQTKKNLRGHEVSLTRGGKLYLGTIISGVFFFLLVCAGGYTVYWAFTKGDITKRFREINDPEAKKRAEESEAQGSQPAPASTPAATAIESLLVVSNERFAKVTIYKNGVRLGQVEKGRPEKFALPPADGKTPVKLTFEVRPEDLGRGTQLIPAVRDALSAGLAFEGTTSDGLRVTFAGPPADLAPKAGELLQGVSAGTGTYDKATATGIFKTFVYKGATFKPADPSAPLRLNWKMNDSGKIELSWIDQDCTIEKDAKAVYTPSMPPFAGTPVKLAVRDGKVDIAP